jgi:hypothetical protein
MVPLFPRRTVEDAAIDLIRIAQTFDSYRAESERVAAALEARWAANRAARCPDLESEA